MNVCSITRRTLSLKQNLKICLSNLKKKKTPSSHTLPKPNLRSLHRGCARLPKPSVFKAYLPPCLPQPVCWFNNLQWDFTRLIMQNHCLCIRSATCLTNLNSVTPLLGGSPVWSPPTGPADQARKRRREQDKRRHPPECLPLSDGPESEMLLKVRSQKQKAKQKEKKN